MKKRFAVTIAVIAMTGIAVAGCTKVPATSAPTQTATLMEICNPATGIVVAVNMSKPVPAGYERDLTACHNAWNHTQLAEVADALQSLAVITTAGGEFTVTDQAATPQASERIYSIQVIPDQAGNLVDEKHMVLVKLGSHTTGVVVGPDKRLQLTTFKGRTFTTAEEIARFLAEQWLVKK